MNERFESLEVRPDPASSAPPVVVPPPVPLPTAPPPVPRSRFLTDGASGPNRARIGLDTAEEDFTVDGKFTWRHAVTDNPGIRASRYVLRRFLGPVTPGTWAVGLGLGAVIVLVMSIYATQMTFAMGCTMFFMAAPFIAILVSLFGLHATIAGERERRSWEMLVTTPLSKVQIVASRLSMYVTGILLAVIAAAMTGVFASILREIRVFWNSSLSSEPYLKAGDVSAFLVSCVLFMGAAWMYGTLAVFISSRSRRAFGSFGAFFGVMAGFYIVAPVLMVAMNSSSRATNVFLEASPFYRLAELWSRTSNLNASSEIATSLAVALVHFVMGCLFFYFAARGLTRADNISVNNPKGAKTRA